MEVWVTWRGNCGPKSSPLWIRRFASVRTRRKHWMELSWRVWSPSRELILCWSLLGWRQRLGFRLRFQLLIRRRILLPLPSSSWPSSPYQPRREKKWFLRSIKCVWIGRVGKSFRSEEPCGGAESLVSCHNILSNGHLWLTQKRKISSLRNRTEKFSLPSQMFKFFLHHCASLAMLYFAFIGWI